jgi:hypothetical protein
MKTLPSSLTRHAPEVGRSREAAAGPALLAPRSPPRKNRLDRGSRTSRSRREAVRAVDSGAGSGAPREG